MDDTEKKNKQEIEEIKKKLEELKKMLERDNPTTFVTGDDENF